MAQSWGRSDKVPSCLTSPHSKIIMTTKFKSSICDGVLVPVGSGTTALILESAQRYWNNICCHPDDGRDVFVYSSSMTRPHCAALQQPGYTVIEGRFQVPDWPACSPKPVPCWECVAYYKAQTMETSDHWAADSICQTRPGWNSTFS